jgi:hypothetical protein
MKKIILRRLCVVVAGLMLASMSQAAHHANKSKSGPVELSSSGSLAFGPNGVLFVADQKAARILAIKTGDTKMGADDATYKIKDIDLKVAATLGTSPDQILINDVVVNPASRNVYLSVSRGKGANAQAVILTVNPGGKIELFDLSDVSYTEAIIPNAPEDKVTGQGRRAANKRMSVVTDMAYVNEQLIVAGLSNEEFASTLRAIPYPFKNVNAGASIEIYHGNHGKYETHSPVRTFVPFDIGGDVHIVAAYTCTPLVTFPLSSLQPKAHVMGKTIAELGNRNRPLDMIVYSKAGSNYLLMANSARGVMKVEAMSLDGFEGIVAKVTNQEFAGVPYKTIEDWTGIMQLDLLDSNNALVLQESASGALNLLSIGLP